MERDVVMKKLTPIFREVFSEPNLELQDDMTADDVERWDSLSHMIMISKVEEEFGVKFKLKELNKLKQFGDIISLLEEKCQ